MARGLSIHIGLNRVDPTAYKAWEGLLTACANDALDMQILSESLGYESTLLVDEAATSSATLEKLGHAAKTLLEGDILLFTYSGYGGRIPGDYGEGEGKEGEEDETWALYDRMLVVDELYGIWAHFARGVRIVVLVDSCHGGTMLKAAEYVQLSTVGPLTRAYAGSLRNPPSFRAVPWDVALASYRQNLLHYKSRQQTARRGDCTHIEASVLMITACQGNQLSAEGSRHGLFTSTLLKVWDGGRFQGNYRTLWQRILQHPDMPSTQSPGYSKLGARDQDFDKQEPFTINLAVSSRYQHLPCFKIESDH